MEMNHFAGLMTGSHHSDTFICGFAMSGSVDTPGEPQSSRTHTDTDFTESKSI